MSTAVAAPQFAFFPQLPKELRLLVWKAALPGPRVVEIRQRPVKEKIGEWEVRTGKEWPEMIGKFEDKTQWHTEDENEDQETPHEREDENYRGHNLEDDSRRLWFNDELERNRNGIRAEMAQAISSQEHDTGGYKEAKLLGIYSESRVPRIMFACREARDVFLQHYTAAFHCTGSIPQTYFDFSIDTLYIRYDCFSHYFSKEGLGSISLDLEYRSCIEDLSSLRKVQKMAILIKDRSDITEVDLASIFGIFGGIKQFIIVLWHFVEKGQFKYYVQDSQDYVEQTQLVMLDPMNVEKSITGFYNSRPPTRSWKGWRAQVAPKVNPISLDMEKLERYRLADCEEGAFPWQMPQIDQKVVLPLRLKRELKAAKSMARR